MKVKENSVRLPSEYIGRRLPGQGGLF